MNDEQFWALIGMLAGPHDTEDEDEIVDPLVGMLRQLEREQITAFDDLLAEKLHALDGRAFADAAGIAGNYEDLFLDARLCVVANGREFYEAVLADPSEMPAMRFGALLFCAERAWEAKTGEEYEHVPPVSVEMGANEANW
ncbi:MAG: DUF4240 domain-containing protein [Planctomycetota bacterium]